MDMKVARGRLAQAVSTRACLSILSHTILFAVRSLPTLS